MLVEFAAIAIAYVVSGVGTWIILKFVDATVGLRVKEEAELQGIDISEHGEEGYNEEFGDRISMSGRH